MAIPVDTKVFEKQYICLRIKEGRLYTDEEVAQLPVIGRSHPLYNEWQIRKQSLSKLLSHISKKGNNPDILEVGCGNGWLSAQLAAHTFGEVWGTDINQTELTQAKRVFSNISNLRFVYGDLRERPFPGKKFSLVIFAASIQYFPSLREILETAQQYLEENGEIHILDAHFYPKAEIDAARQRTKNYYRLMDAGEMTGFYFHHALDELEGFNYTILRDPHSWKNKFSLYKNPFHWITIKK